eukprot:jgi/Mesvir1/2591/Mv13007-RA.1
MANVDLKVVLLGKQSVGKSCLVDRYLNSKFLDAPKNTIGAAFGAKRVNVGNRSITLGIWDTAGAERFESLSRVYYHSAGAAIVCFDVTDASSFEKLKFWVEELRDSEDSCKLYFVATKCDLLEDAGFREAVRDEDVRAYVRQHAGKYFRTSAKTGMNIEALFMSVAEDFAASSKPPGGTAGAAGTAGGAPGVGQPPVASPVVRITATDKDGEAMTIVNRRACCTG